jgi:hypothetical protein
LSDRICENEDIASKNAELEEGKLGLELEEEKIQRQVLEKEVEKLKDILILVHEAFGNILKNRATRIEIGSSIYGKDRVGGYFEGIVEDGLIQLV